MIMHEEVLVYRGESTAMWVLHEKLIAFEAAVPLWLLVDNACLHLLLDS